MSPLHDAGGSRSRIVIAGGSGFIGRSLADRLSRDGFDVDILTRGRSITHGEGRVRALTWDARTLGPWASALNDSAGVVNLVGRSVDCVKTPDHCDEILRSRTEATRVLGEACRMCDKPPPVWVQMSTAHIYGDPPTIHCDESSPTGWGLAPDVGRAWEAEFNAACPRGVRRVVLRTGFVIGRPNPGGAGALAKLGLLARLGLGGRVGGGNQGMSWIHDIDLNRIILRAFADESMQGVYNAVAPNPVAQVEFMRELSQVAGGLGALGVRLPASEWMVRLGARFVLRTDPELALYGRYILPARLTREGFAFEYPGLRAALTQCFG